MVHQELYENIRGDKKRVHYVIFACVMCTYYVYIRANVCLTRLKIRRSV